MGEPIRSLWVECVANLLETAIQTLDTEHGVDRGVADTVSVLIDTAIHIDSTRHLYSDD